MKTVFNSKKFRNDIIKKRMIDLFISMDEAGKQIGISKATVSRVESGKLPDIETFIKICIWLETDPRTYWNDPDIQPRVFVNLPIELR